MYVVSLEYTPPAQCCLSVVGRNPSSLIESKLKIKTFVRQKTETVIAYMHGGSGKIAIITVLTGSVTPFITMYAKVVCIINFQKTESAEHARSDAIMLTC